MTLHKIYAAVQMQMRVPDILAKTRNIETVTARHIARYIATTHAQFALQEVARYESCNHATVSNSRDKAEDFLQTHKNLRNQVTIILQKLTLDTMPADPQYSFKMQLKDLQDIFNNAVEQLSFAQGQAFNLHPDEPKIREEFIRQVIEEQKTSLADKLKMKAEELVK